jgi:CheY-like chemotaxis protein
MTPAWPGIPGSHTAIFYEREPFCRHAIEAFLAAGARAGAPLALIARPRMFDAILERLASSDAGVTPERIVFVDAEATLATVMDGHTLVADRVERALRTLLERVARVREDGPVWIIGEMVDLMCRQGDHLAALDLETLWNVFTVGRPVVTGCAYALEGFSDDRHVSLLPPICDQHTHLIPTESLTDGPPEPGRPEYVALLQHRARGLGLALKGGSQPAREPTGTPAPTIYVIDDDLSVRRSLARLLASVDMPVRTFDSAEAFLEESDTSSGGCLIVDVQLLGMSGTDLLRRLAGARQWPIVAMSGADDTTLEREALCLGAVAFLRKPFVADALLEAIARAFS